MNIFKEILFHIKTLIGIFLIWCCFVSFNTDKEILILGIFSSVTCIYILSKMEILNHKNHHLFSINFIKYILILFKEIFKSTLYVTKLIFGSMWNIKSIIIKIPLDKSNDQNHKKVMLANIITMTPGTMTISVSKNEMLIHSMSNENDPNDSIKQIKGLI